VEEITEEMMTVVMVLAEAAASIPVVMSASEFMKCTWVMELRMDHET